MKVATEKLTSIEVLKRYFDNPPLTNREIMDLSKEERVELAHLAAKHLGVECTSTV